MEKLVVPRSGLFMGDFIEAVSLSASFDLLLCQTQSPTFELAKRVLRRACAEVGNARRSSVLVGASAAAILDVLGFIIHGTRLYRLIAGAQPGSQSRCSEHGNDASMRRKKGAS